MKLLKRLWSDQCGAILSSELVLVGTVGVIGATVGLNAMSTAINEELEDVAFAFRSLDQSYKISEVKGCNAWTAGSSFTQEPVKESLRELDRQIDRDEAAARKKQAELERQAKQKEAEAAKQPSKAPQKKPEMKKPAPKKTPPSRKKPKKNRSEEEVLL